MNSEGFFITVNGKPVRTFTSDTLLTDSFNLGVTGNGDCGDVVAVTVRAEIRRFDRMLADEHWLGAGQAAGQALRGRWLATPFRRSP